MEFCTGCVGGVARVSQSLGWVSYALYSFDSGAFWMFLLGLVFACPEGDLAFPVGSLLGGFVGIFDFRYG